MYIIKTDNLTKKYGSGDAEVVAIKDINIKIKKGSITAVVGESGSGKSTLLHCIAALDDPTSGLVMFKDKDIYSLSEEQRSILRRKSFGFIFQSFNLIPVMNVYDNITFPVLLDKNQIDKSYIDSVIEKLGIMDKINKYPNQLSGGQQQRVAIARALANRPEVIFADEPTGNLDSKTTAEVVEILEFCVREFGQTLVMITHDNDIASKADCVITIQDGLVVDNFDSTKI
ncbi:ABC transporter ATP-binding protein [Clostridioides mangenotii]|uniref:ABC transporter ATP-binding protein n=1 Tax=Metaclostridioides mangenotii TaxID=1540 RepID=UPI002149AEA7|nr:ABC transporter ATP-binding protein [Clostridioides mangenotii]MCR1954499.1 ABC transporter ATP-binding protein [Clostridioides mangenotii]